MISKHKNEFFVIEVIAMILKYLKDKLLNLDEISRGLTGALEATDFSWVITVPAMWKARGKQMMREAAYMVGIVLVSSYVHTIYSIKLIM